MLTKCMLTPLKLARLVEWNGRLGKPSALMAIDISNQQIGIALAYHRQQSLAISQQTDANEAGPGRDMDNGSAAITTSITLLPPIPYMSHDPYHPSYAFLHHHRSRDEFLLRSLDRVERTLEVADQLAQLAHDRKVKSILVRWPGDLASAITGGRPEGELVRERYEGQLLFPIDREDAGAVGSGNDKSDGTMGYMRGRILYLLDKCCASHGHNERIVQSEPLLVEGSRPFALWDTSRSEQDWITYQQQNKHSHAAARPLIPKKEDKYGNSLTEMDLWGRAAIFGNQPPPPRQGKFYYSSKQRYSGYRVSSQFESKGSGVFEGRVVRNPHLRNENFDSLHDNESRMGQFHGSLSAMHALHDFAKENLQGRIVLPTWASAFNVASNDTSKGLGSDVSLFDEKYDEGISGRGLGARRRTDAVSFVSPTTSTKSTLADGSNSSNNVRVSTTPTPNKKTNGLATLAQMPTRKVRRRGKRGA